MIRALKPFARSTMPLPFSSSSLFPSRASPFDAKIQKRSFSDDPSLFFWAGITIANMLNIHDAKFDVTTAKLVGFCIIKGGFYTITLPFSLVGMALTYDRFNDHLIPASVWCKHLNPALSPSREDKQKKNKEEENGEKSEN